MEASEKSLKQQTRYDRLAADHLGDGTIRLLSTPWLRSRAEGFVLSRRQVRSALHSALRSALRSALHSALCSALRSLQYLSWKDLPEEAFIPPNEAVRLLQASDRLIGALSYGWLTPLHSDPHGINTALVLQFLRSEAGLRLHALFWDFASCAPTLSNPDPDFGLTCERGCRLPQKNSNGERTLEEAERFARGVKVMAALCKRCSQTPTASWSDLLTADRLSCRRFSGRHAGGAAY